MERKNVDYGVSAEEIRAVFERHGESFDEVTVPRLVHWDAWDLNIFVKDAEVTGLLDFERSLWGDPLLEAHFRRLFPHDQAILAAYGKTTFTDAEEARSWIYTLHLGLIMKTEALYRMYPDDEVDGIGSRLVDMAMAYLQAH